MVQLFCINLTTKKGIVCLYLSLGSLSSLSSPPHTALTDSVGSLLQQFNLNVPGTRRDLHLFESRCHPGASRKAKSPERVAPCSAPHTISQHIAGNTRTSHTRSLSETCFLGWKPGLDSFPAPLDPQGQGSMRCCSSKRPLGVTSTCTDTHTCEMLLFPFAASSSAFPTPTPFFLSYVEL